MTIGQKIIHSIIAILALHCSAVFAGETFYYYDGASRLSRTEYIGAVELDYAYDSIGNRIHRQLNANTSTSNQPPNVPTSPTPVDSAQAVLSGAGLTWVGGDPDVDDLVLYDVYFGKSASPPLVSSDVHQTGFALGNLDSFSTYY